MSVLKFVSKELIIEDPRAPFRDITGQYKKDILSFLDNCKSKIEKEFGNEFVIVTKEVNFSWKIYAFKNILEVYNSEIFIADSMYMEDENFMDMNNIVHIVFVDLKKNAFNYIYGESLHRFTRFSDEYKVIPLTDTRMARFINHMKHTSLEIVPYKRKPGRDKNTPVINVNENCIVFSKKDNSEYKSDSEFINSCKELTKTTKYKNKENLVAFMVSGNDEPGINCIVLYDDVVTAKKEFGTLRYSNNVIMTKW